MTRSRVFMIAVLVLVAVGCGDGADPEGVDDPNPSVTSAPAGADDVSDDRPCEGGAFPDDTEFREAICAVQWAQVDLMTAGGEFDPEWGQRQSAAILSYAEDRDAALDELIALAAEIGAAIDDAGGS